MEKALILLKIECLGGNCLENVLEKVQGLPGVREAGMTFGEFDIYLISEVDKSLEITRLVMEIRSYPSVMSTTTLLIVD
ncbi:MAG TPA: Lrp/AsnC ligand binding domain-containing protein [Patescibacteria group bacterium]|nr:Lrp/AsnC ligand binding domain-containing protein [Patescibacteria group bacterium]